MVAKDPRQRSQLSRIAANVRWAHEWDPQTATEPARRGFDARFVAEVDPDGVLAPAELAPRVAAARRAHFQRLAMRSAAVRRRKRAA